MARAFLIEALDELEAEGQSLKDILKAELRERPLQTLKALAAFEPRESDVTVSQEMSLTQLLELAEDEWEARAHAEH